MSRTFKIAAAVIAASLILAPAALAQEVSMPVAYGDLDMSSNAGGVTLLRRIEGAARKVCDKAVPRSPLTPRAVTTCRRETVEGAVRGLNIGALTLAWTGKYPATDVASR